MVMDKGTQTAWLAAASSTLLLMATRLSEPFVREKLDRLGCDATCHSSLTSARAAATLLGSTLVGRLSDNNSLAVVTTNEHEHATHYRRHFCLLLGIAALMAGLLASHLSQDLVGVWLGLILPQLFQHNATVMKALLSEHHDVSSSDVVKRVSSFGMLGTASGLAKMLGPLVGSVLLASNNQATFFSVALLITSALFVIFISPPKAHDGKQAPRAENKEPPKAQNKAAKDGSLLGFPVNLSSSVVPSPAALYILADRLLSYLSYHMFHGIWQASLKQRFAFDKNDYGRFYFAVAFFLTLAKGVVTPWLLKIFPSRSANLLVICSLAAAVLRYAAFYTTRVELVYVLYALLITAIGVSSTIIGAEKSRVAERYYAGSAGTFFGALDTIERGSEMIAPWVATALASRVHATLAPLHAAALFSVLSVLLTVYGYGKWVVSPPIDGSQKKKKKD